MPTPGNDARAPLRRALDHHERRGAVLFYREPSPGQRHWVVQLLGCGGTDRYTTAQIQAMCDGLAASERASR